MNMFPLFKSEVKTYHTLFHKERKKAFEGLAFLTSIVSVNTQSKIKILNFPIWFSDGDFSYFACRQMRSAVMPSRAAMNWN